AGPAGPGPPHGLGDPAVTEVVVLDEDGVGQVAPVVGAAAGPDGGLLQGPEARGGLAGVADPAPAAGGCRCFGVGPGQGGNARQVAEEVERRPLPGQDGPQRTADRAEPLAGGERVAVG